MIFAPHWDLRKYIGKIRSLPTTSKPLKSGKPNRVGAEARFYVLHYLIASANMRLRCYPGIETIMEDTGFEKAPVIAALAWLETHGVMYNVPQDKRVGQEAKLHPRKKVWQLTGVIELEGQVLPYLVMKDDHRKMVMEELASYGKQTAPIVAMIQQCGSTDEQQTLPKGSSNEQPISNGGSFDERSLNEPEVNTNKDSEGIKDSAPQADADAPPKIVQFPSRDETPEPVKPKPERKPDPLFDAVQVYIFGIALDQKPEGGRIGKISSWLAAKNEGKRERVGKISKAAEPQHVKMFVEWCERKGFTPPKDFVTFVENWRKWATEMNGSLRSKSPLSGLNIVTSDSEGVKSA